jgi:hypothetical protein
VDVATRTNDSSGGITTGAVSVATSVRTGGDTNYAVSSRDATVTPSHGMSAMDATASTYGLATAPSTGASRMPCSTDVVVVAGGTLIRDARDAPMPTLPISGVVSTDPWCVDR